jgi:hypothetical protein
MLRRMALVRTDVSEEFKRATRHNIPEDTILKRYGVFFMKSYVAIHVWQRWQSIIWYYACEVVKTFMFGLF